MARAPRRRIRDAVQHSLEPAAADGAVAAPETAHPSAPPAPTEKTPPLAARVAAIQARARPLRRESASASKPVAEHGADTQRPPRGSGRGSDKIVAERHRELERYVMSRDLSASVVRGREELVTPLTRVPLFPPVRRETAMEITKRGWVPLKSRWDSHGVMRTGPPLTVYDEDTLLGLAALRRYRLEGSAGELPIPLGLEDKDRDRRIPNRERTSVHGFYCVLSQLEAVIQGYMPEGGWSGQALARRRQSVIDLSGVSLMFRKPIGANAFAGGVVRILDVQFVENDRESVFYVQFDPLLTQWWESYTTYISLRLRRKLSPLGRAVYRFLASQRSNGRYRVEFVALLEAIGASGEPRKLKDKLAPQMRLMQQEGFLAKWAFSGTGRSEPFVLEVEFAQAGD